jgi:hypothetical protein
VNSRPSFFLPSKIAQEDTALVSPCTLIPPLALARQLRAGVISSYRFRSTAYRADDCDQRFRVYRFCEKGCRATFPIKAF